MICYCFKYRILAPTKSLTSVQRIAGITAKCVRNQDVPSYLSGVDQVPNCLRAQPQSLEIPHIPTLNARIAQSVQLAAADWRFEKLHCGKFLRNRRLRSGGLLDQSEFFLKGQFVGIIVGWLVHNTNNPSFHLVLLLHITPIESNSCGSGRIKIGRYE